MFESTVYVEVVNHWAGVTLLQRSPQPVKEDRKNSPVPVLISHNGHIYYFCYSQDSAFEFEKKRNVPVKYNRELWSNTGLWLSEQNWVFNTRIK